MPPPAPLDIFDRDELQAMLKRCVTRSQLIEKYKVHHSFFDRSDCPEPVWKFDRTVVYDKSEFMNAYRNRTQRKPWSHKEIERMIELKATGIGWKRIAVLMDRSFYSCTQAWRIHALPLVQAREREREDAA